MLLFTISIPALYNSPQLKDFFRVRTHKHHLNWSHNWSVFFLLHIFFLSSSSLQSLYLQPPFLFRLPLSCNLTTLSLPFPQGGEVSRPLDPSPLSSEGPLPPPLIPLPKRRASDCQPAEEEEGREAPTLPQDLGTNLSLEVGEPEVAAEAYSEIGGSPREGQVELSDTELDDQGITVHICKGLCFLLYFF